MLILNDLELGMGVSTLSKPRRLTQDLNAAATC
jgi:hypothetical protein